MTNFSKLAIPMAITAFLTTPVLANSDLDNNNKTENSAYAEVTSSKYTSFIGTIEEINKNDDSTYITAKYGEEVKTFNVNDKAIILDNGNKVKVGINELSEGQKINVFFMYDNMKDTDISSEIIPELVVIKNNEYRSVKLDMFNEEFVSTDNNLQLNISEDTKIVDLEGNNLSKEDVINETIIVFYTMSTKDIPAITIPEKIIVVDRDDYVYVDETENNNQDYELSSAEKDILSKIGKESVYKKDDTLYVGITAVAAEINYNVTWSEEDRKVSLENGHELYEFVIGEKPFLYNGEEYTLDNPPILINDRTFIEESFLDKLLK